MAVELIGTTVGVVGFLGQLFDGCVKAYGYFTAASQMDTDSQRLLCKVRIEEMRLVVWGREWGVAEGRLDAHLREGDGSKGTNPGLRDLATEILQGLHRTVTDFKKLKERYGLRDAGGGGGGVEEKVSGSDARERSFRKELLLRSKWVIGDKDKFTDLLTHLKDFNDGLERLFPPHQLPSFQRAWTYQLLESAQRDVAQLALLEKASTGTYPHLHNTANLKKLRINLDAKPQSAFKPTYALKVGRSALTLVDETSSTSSGGQSPARRSRACHDSAGDVLVEWVEYDREALEERLSHLRRMDDLARMMHSASANHPDLHGLDCLGYTDDASASRYGLVYRVPKPRYSSLHTLITDSGLKTPDLDDRVRLASTLAVALWSLHSLDWLHKSLCASNILFFPGLSGGGGSGGRHGATTDADPDSGNGSGNDEGRDKPDVAAPRIAGFDASRPDLDTALSLAPRNPSIAHLHRHPSSLRGLPHCKAFDIYSLGLVLLEIGLWKALQAYHKPHYSAERWRDRVVLPVLVPGLGSKVGKRYREVVEMCLGVEEGMTSAEAGKLMESVVTKLESIRL